MHMVCQEHESAYWDGSKGVCCDKSIKQVANENRYACCEEWQNAYLYNNAVVCCNEDPNTTPNNLCCTGRLEDGRLEKAYKSDLTIHFITKINGSYSSSTTSASAACCYNDLTNSPSEYSTRPEEYGGPYIVGRLCCRSGAPYYGPSTDFGGGWIDYACYQGQPELVGDTDHQKLYDYCPNGYRDWWYSENLDGYFRECR